MNKNLYCIRHGLALHNVMFWHIGTKAYREYRDTPLLDEGYNQANTLKNNWEEIKNIELVLVSPCMRTLQTSTNINEKTDWPEKDETVEELEKRIQILKDYIKTRPEKNIAIVSHSSYIGQMIFKKIEDEKNELKHCSPYLYKL